MMDTLMMGMPRPAPETSNRLYTTREVADLLGLEVHTLRHYIRRQHRIKPQRVTTGSHGVMVFTTADVLALWEYIKTERGE